MPKKASKTVLPDPLPNGEILQDIAKKKWVLGPSIGVGGFGEIYSAAEFVDGSKKSSNYQYVVKIEPHGNGPLFCEMHFFMRNAKPDMIKTWCSDHKVTSLGMPRYLGSGSHEHNGKKYRFLVMDKYGKDLWKIYLANRKQFPIITVYRICLQILDVLEYIHSNGYVHADIKGANILLGLTKQSENQVFLVDYGLASKYTQKDFKPDPKKAHNGTIEYTSRDAHDGVPTRRGDIEILAYNMVQWMGNILPWENSLSNPVTVHNSKKKYVDDIPEFLSKCYGKKNVPAAVKEFLVYVASMDYDTEPDYKKLRNILTKGLKAESGSISGPLEFKLRKQIDDDLSETPEKKLRLTPKRKAKQEKVEDSESETENIPVKSTRGRKKREPVSATTSEPVTSQPVSNGYNAEMLRLQRKLAERKIGKSKKPLKSSSSSSGNDANDDIIDATPPEQLIVKRKRRVKSATTSTTDSEELTPRSLRQRR